MTTRRQAVAALGACALGTPRALIAQGARVYRIGWLSLASTDVITPFFEAFRQGLRQRGYVEGRDFVIDVRLAAGSRERADEMAIALAQAKADVIVTQGGAVRSAERHAGAIPIVIAFSGDPVEAKLVNSLARPGGTRTGMSFLALELVGKRLELLVQILPPGSKIAIIADPEHPGERSEFRASETAAQEIGVKLDYFPVGSVAALEGVFRRITDGGAQAIMAFPDAFTLEQRERIAAFAIRQRLPSISGWAVFADGGFLMTYGANLRDCYANLATFVDRILKGAKPGDIPIELPTSFEFVLNAKTAKAIGVRLPPALLARADRVIE